MTEAERQAEFRGETTADLKHIREGMERLFSVVEDHGVKIVGLIQWREDREKSETKRMQLTEISLKRLGMVLAPIVVISSVVLAWLLAR